MTFLSVLLRTHKRPKALRRCLNLLNGQTNKNFVIILISDYEKDNIEEVAEEYSDLTFKLEFITNPVGYPNCNVYFNLVKDIVNSQYVVFIDDDDEVEDKTYFEALENIVYADKDNFPAVIISKAQFPSGWVVPEETVWKLFPASGHISTLNFCVRTDLYKKFDWAGNADGDYHFIHSIFENIDWRKEVYWYNKITTSSPDFPGQGKGQEN